MVKELKLAPWALLMAAGLAIGCGGPTGAGTSVPAQATASLNYGGYSVLVAEDEPGPPGPKGSRQRVHYCATWQCAFAADKRWCMRRCVFSWDL